jgi:hypothetical protein
MGSSPTVTRSCQCALLRFSCAASAQVVAKPADYSNTAELGRVLNIPIIAAVWVGLCGTFSGDYCGHCNSKRSRQDNKSMNPARTSIG